MGKGKKMSWFVKILLLAAFSMMMLIVVALAVGIIFGGDYNAVNAQITTIVLQNVLVFMAPVVLLALFCRAVEQRPVLSTLWMTKAPSLKSITLVVIVYIVALPAMNWLIDWNNGLHLPSAMHELEQLLRSMEDSAQEVTMGLLTTHTWAGMLAMVLMVGLLTGMGEEMFFRAGMLGAMRHDGVNKHLAVWAVAVIFSAIHMQFFGFVPRLLMGAWFGYVMLWSGEVWTPVIAHSLNNAAVVVATFLAKNHYIDDNWIETLGVPQQGNVPWLALGSAVATVVIIYLFMHARETSRDANN